MAFDTTAAAQEAQRRVWKRLGPEGRVRTTVELSEAARRITLTGLAERHPDLDADELMRRYIARVHGVEVGAADG